MARKVKGASGYIVEGDVMNPYGNLTGEKLSGIQAIKHFCLDCQGGHHFDWRTDDGKIEKATFPHDAVRDCDVPTCWLYPFRMGTNPNHTGRKKT